MPARRSVRDTGNTVLRLPARTLPRAAPRSWTEAHPAATPAPCSSTSVPCPWLRT